MNNKELSLLVKECTKELQAIGLNVPTMTKYRVSTRMTRAMGNCKIRSQRYTGAVVELVVSISCDLSPKTGKDTLIHEMLHAIASVEFSPREGHGYNWQRLARMVNRAYGYNIQTYASEDKIEEVTPLRQARKSNAYMVTCNCGFKQDITARHRIVRTQSTQGYKCPVCGNKHLTLSEN